MSQNLQFHVIIPARYASTRLEGKVLADIGGKPMIQHVYERALQSGATSVTIATDDDRVVKAAQRFGAPTCLTSSEHDCGTSRIAEACSILNFQDDTIVVNAQGDGIFVPPIIIQQVAENLSVQKNAQVATLYSKISTTAELFNPDIVKLVMDKFGFAMYFSRAPIAWERDNFPKDNPMQASLTTEHYGHIGIYAYRPSLLKEYLSWSPSLIENVEKLEQLRILWHGYKIHAALAKANSPIEVNNADDLEQARNLNRR